jgi:hypothetical protein
VKDQLEIAPPARTAQDFLELEELIRWLALPYGDNEPIFAYSNWDGTPIDSGARLRAVWHRVVGDTSKLNEHGTWVRCPHCGSYQVHSAPL